MLIKAIKKPRLNTILLSILIILFVYTYSSNFNSSVTIQPDQDLNASLTRLDTTLSRKDNCKTFWREAKNWDIPDYNDTDYSQNKNQELKKEIEDRLQRHTALMRLYNHCFIDQNSCDIDVERRLYPWMVFRSPVIIPSDGARRNMFENFKCMRDVKAQLKGKGIAITAKDLHFKELVSLFMVLRSQGNELPLQIVHRGDLSHFAQKKLFRLAQSDFNVEVRTMLNVKGDLPKLHVEFVDISASISPEYKDRLKRFQNKLLAYWFNSFKEVILMDVDAVPFIPLQNFFNLEEYVKTGAFFFKDRSIHTGHPLDDTVDFFKKLFPQRVEQDALGISDVTEKTLDNFFFNGFALMMESGVVIVDRSRHFTNPLMVISLSLWEKSIMPRVWGDKEFYWLALSISGDESYAFNEYHAGSIGEISPTSNSHYPHALHLKEICSNHPAHIYKDGSLLWMNTGFKYCKKIMHMDESNPYFKSWSMKEIDDYNSAPLRIRHALIPPLPKTQGIPFYPDGQEPSYGWEAKSYCEAYTVCAYDHVNGQDGIVFEFNETETQWFDYLGNAYVKGMDVLISLGDK